ncbi:MAG: hypothetical protein U0572_07430 [Phycisphaerales bacterium]
MSLTKTVGLFAGTTLAITGAVFGSTEANTDALEQIAQLKAEINALKAQNGENWLTEQRATEIKGLVQDVLADADTRASLQGAGANAGWDNGFFLASADGNFRLNINGGAQIRWTLDTRNGALGDSQTNHGFSSNYASVYFSGHIVDPSWQYTLGVQFQTGSGDYVGSQPGDAYLNDWWVLKDFGGWYVKGGQFNAPYSRERLMSDYSLQYIGRTNLNYVFGLGRTQGLELGMLSDMFRVAGSLSNGVGPLSPTQNLGYPADGGNPGTTQGQPVSPLNSLAITGRAELKLAGNWKQLESQQSWRGDEMSAMVGLGAYYQWGQISTDSNPQSTDGVKRGGDNYGITLDGTVGFGGFNVTGGLFYFQNNSPADPTGPLYLFGGNGPDSTGYGAFIQGGFFLTESFELALRYEYGDVGDLGAIGAATGNVLAINNLESILQVSGNWYFAKNRAKWQTDVGYSFDSLGIFAANGNGWLPDTTNASGGGEDGQWLIRTGVTVSF